MSQIQIDIILGLHQQEYSELFGEFSSWRSESATCFLRPAPHSQDALMRYLGQVPLLNRFYCKLFRKLDENLDTRQDIFVYLQTDKHCRSPIKATLVVNFYNCNSCSIILKNIFKEGLIIVIVVKIVEKRLE